jgi:hypothetical protein
VITENRFPPGWDEERVRKVLAHYEEQTEAEAVAEDEAAFEEPTQTVMEVPTALDKRALSADFFLFSAGWFRRSQHSVACSGLISL